MRKNKFNAKQVTIDGIKFHSQKEGRRYADLKLLVRSGDITNLDTQPRFDFEHDDIFIGFYKADFRYYDIKTKAWVIEDVKGMKTPIYRLKKKMMWAFHGIKILET